MDGNGRIMKERDWWHLMKVLPFSDEFFLQFGLTTKPNLTRLQLTYNTRAPFRNRRNEYSTGGLNVLLSNCPALEHLDVVLHRLQPCDARIYPQIDEMIDPNVFSDDFFVALSDNCPQLGSLRIRKLGALSNSHKGYSAAVNAITDRGLAALWRAPRLTYIDIQDVRCSGNVILRFVSTDREYFQDKATRQIHFRELGVCFGEVVQRVLDDLARMPNKELVNRLTETPMVISLSSRQGYVFDRPWLVKMQRAFQARFTKRKLCFAVFGLKRDKDTDLYSSSRRSVEQEVIAQVMARAWIKAGVLRVGRLVLYTHKAVLDECLQNVLCKTGRRSSWIITNE
ncbi:unnamed protein product [Peronospora belbahrii]|uniref:F-box domain-containing protein n=1 Tax=Peronospora belbahrii TaxID=622444 RepID=A0AAU9LPE5_9STRA|nr:unnamed protein product [Peronospora belbahrii]